MTKKRVKRLVLAVVLLAIAAFLVPGSPFYLPDLHKPAQEYAGHPKSYWTEHLDDSDREVRLEAIRAMGEFGPSAHEAVPRLAIFLVEDGDRAVRNEAALSLSKMSAPSAVAALAAALEDPEPIVRLNACIALSRLRAEARPALPALIKALENEDNDTNAGVFHFTIQEIAALSVGRASAGTADGIPALIQALAAARSPEMRRAIARAFGEIGPAARPAAPRLRRFLTDVNKSLREAAAEALAAIGVDPKDDSSAGQAVAAPAELELAKTEREYLWDIEHHGNLLVKHGFGPLATALSKADRKSLIRMLSDDFAGADLREPRRLRTAAAFAEVERLEDSGVSSTPMSRDAFVDRLLESRKIFGEAAPTVKLALKALSPKQRGQIDGPWEGTAQLRMSGESKKGAPAEVVIDLHYWAARPSEELFAKPGWLRGARVLQVQTAQARQYLFAEVGQERGLKTANLHDNWKAPFFVPVTGGVYVCDFDRDGILDVLVTDLKSCTLYRGLPDGFFEDATALVGLPTNQEMSGATAWVDIDGDGWEDLILAGRVFRNKEGRQFEDYTNRLNLTLPFDASGITVADYDRDGKLDLYFTRTGRPNGDSWLEGGGGTARGNTLLHNLGNWRFEDVTKASGTRGGYRSAFTAAWLDANNDGWPDLHVINEFGDGLLLINRRDGTFAPQTLADRPADFGSMGLAVGDLDNDGNIDIYCGNMYSKAGSRVIGNLAADAFPAKTMDKMRQFVAGSQVHRNRGDLKFEQAGKKMQVAAVGWAYGPCLADLDNDGFLDIYATAGFASRDRSKPDG